MLFGFKILLKWGKYRVYYSYSSESLLDQKIGNQQVKFHLIAILLLASPAFATESNTSPSEQPADTPKGFLDKLKTSKVEIILTQVSSDTFISEGNGDEVL